MLPGGPGVIFAEIYKISTYLSSFTQIFKNLLIGKLWFYNDEHINRAMDNAFKIFLSHALNQISSPNQTSVFCTEDVARACCSMAMLYWCVHHYNTLTYQLVFVLNWWCLQNLLSHALKRKVNNNKVNNLLVLVLVSTAFGVLTSQVTNKIS